MNIYPLLETLSRVGSKPALRGLIRGNLNCGTDHKDSEFSQKMQKALDLLDEAKSIEDFLMAAKDL